MAIIPRMDNLLDLAPEVAAALAAGRPVVALESTVVAHGLPPPENLDCLREMEARVRARGAVPAVIALDAGRVRVGLDADTLARLGRPGQASKVSSRDLGAILAKGTLGATTVSATLWCASLAGIEVMATGGIGGVHRGGEASLDVSTDLKALADTRAILVSAGAKGLLDLGRTLEVLETLGVPVVGFRTDELPAFWCAESGLRTPHRADGPEEVARFFAAGRALGLPAGLLVAQPPPAESALSQAEVEAAIGRALCEADAAGIRGPAITPFVLARIAEHTGGRSLAANRALLIANAGLAAEIAIALAAL